ncbi:ribokinase [Bacillus sp. NTK034]|uniref:ribokinase n=1 Tax=Bacillus sp. NTK034 TaxID=2802176 RepID=UPI001A8E9355|nr:ribokinase [Bacillus sp. NTK034]MBN8201465.1 ribokinase [Bacillus sp. NTK034]
MRGYKPKITVVGSINMDLVTESNRFPEVGETIIGKAFKQFPGGKGANQAVAAARLGGEVSFIGCIGHDVFGKELIRRLDQEKVNLEGLEILSDEPTGIAQITVSNKENSIIVVPGANYKISKDWIENKRSLIVNADILLVQLEISLEIVEQVLEIAGENQIPVILNPAPAQTLPRNLLNKITYLTPNESELTLLTEGKGSDLAGKMDAMLKMDIDNVITTRGANGVAYKSSHDEQVFYKDSLKVKAVDSTGAGDSFNGALAVALGSGKSLEESIEFSTKVAALSVTKLGAQSGMPFVHELDQK